VAEESSTEELNPAFKAIVDADASSSVLNRFEPIISVEIGIDENGFLLLTGDYPTQPSRVHFQQKYIYVGLSRKLVAFSIQANQASAWLSPPLRDGERAGSAGTGPRRRGPVRDTDWSLAGC